MSDAVNALAVDHVVLAAPDLEQAKADFERLTGVLPVDGGPHPGGGTRNALVSFGGGCYLEIIAPDPQQDLAGTNGARLARLTQPELLHWALRSNDLAQVSLQLSAVGFTPGSIRDMARDTPDGKRLEWQLMGMVEHRLGGLAPFFIDWKDTPHPALTAPFVGKLETLQLGLTPDYSSLATLLAGTPSLSIAQTSGAQTAGLVVGFESPKGAQTLENPTLKGFNF